MSLDKDGVVFESLSQTPMMKQYLEIKRQYSDALLLYRMGDFYEMFMDDAVAASRILNIALTSRDKSSETPVPMCGVPYHAAENYISKLVSSGFKVAICEQVEDPRLAKGIVKRAVTRVITPGLVLEEQNLSSKKPNYLAGLFNSGEKWGIAYLDISTGDFKTVEVSSFGDALEELYRIEPRELLITDNVSESLTEKIASMLEVSLQRVESSYFDAEAAEERLRRLFSLYSLDGLGLQNFSSGICAAGAVLRYAEDNHLSTSHIKILSPYYRSDFMNLDENTIRNLEIFYSHSFKGKKGSLLEILDRTCTAMGGRKLQQWLRYPLVKRRDIIERQDTIEELVSKPDLLRDVRSLLSKVGDIERIVSRIQTGLAAPRDFNALKTSLRCLPSIRRLIETLKSSLMEDLSGKWDDLDDVVSLIDSILVENPPLNWVTGSIIKEGVDPILDECRLLSRDSKEWLLKYEEQEKRETGLSSLKVRYNKVFGYFIEVSKGQASHVPSHYQRKQTLVNAERFITESLKDLEIKVLEAESKRQELEKLWFEKLRSQILLHRGRLQTMADAIALLDCLVSLSDLAFSENYTRPIINDNGLMIIKSGRHPVVEKYLPRGAFVSNDIELNMDDQQLIIITGPNMAGKSTILRQTALIVLLAHVGSFVPAASAVVPLTDRIFTRIGASDDLARGRSTFLVEMQETAYILNQASPKSFVILDEIGRGTSTYDGVSIAWSVIEYLHDLHDKGVKTLCATHYHELTQLAGKLPRVKNFSVAVREWQDQIIFTHRLIPEKANKSYGIHVAKLAGLPERVIDRAREILAKLEDSPSEEPRDFEKTLIRIARKPRVGFQLPLLDAGEESLKEELLSLDLDRTTPMTALQILFALQEKFKRSKVKT